MYLNPPPKPEPAPSAPVAKSEPRPVGPVAAKFKLIGTSRHVLQPELSLALIDEPGKGLYWVRQSSKVGHLIVEQVRDGLVVVRDGQNTFELVAERPEQKSLLKANTSSSSSSSPIGRITGSNPPEAVKPEAVNPETVKTAAEGQPGAEEKEMTEAEMKRAITELEAMPTKEDVAKADVQADETDSNSKVKEIAAVRKKSISDLETMRISAKEARGLNRLGRRLRNVQREPSRVKDNRNDSNATLIEPSLNKPSLNEPGANDVNTPS